MKWFLYYGIAFAVFMVIDLIWLGFIAKDLYAKYLGFIMAKNINWTAAIIFYMIFVGGILFFVVNPAIEKNSLSYALLAGAAFGFITYATYDLTNLATLENWPLFITIVDLIWGSFLSASTSVVSFLVIKTFIVNTPSTYRGGGFLVNTPTGASLPKLKRSFQPQ